MGLSTISEALSPSFFFYQLTACLFSTEDAARQTEAVKENSLIFKVGKLENDEFAVAKRKQSLDLTNKHGIKGHLVLYNFSSMST